MVTLDRAPLRRLQRASTESAGIGSSLDMDPRRGVRVPLVPVIRDRPRRALERAPTTLSILPVDGATDGLGDEGTPSAGTHQVVHLPNELDVKLEASAHGARFAHSLSAQVLDRLFHRPFGQVLLEVSELHQQP
jgi:hypothetical protein